VKAIFQICLKIAKKLILKNEKFAFFSKFANIEIYTFLLSSSEGSLSFTSEDVFTDLLMQWGRKLEPEMSQNLQLWPLPLLSGWYQDICLLGQLATHFFHTKYLGCSVFFVYLYILTSQ